jgi:transcriptional regulator with XRE-family HTH domain
MPGNLGTRRTTEEWLHAIGSGLRERRFRAGLTQDEVARRADVSLSSVKHLESGAGATLTSLVKVVRALGAEEWLDALAIPAEPAISPMQLLRGQRNPPSNRRRVRRPRPGPGSS